MVEFHEFGRQGGEIVVLLSPACASHELWQDYIDRLENRYRIVAPDYTGHRKGEHYTSMEDNARQISAYLKNLEREIFLIWGVSGGASTGLKILALDEAPVRYAVADAPYVFEKLTLKDRITAVKIGAAVASLPFLSKKKKAAFLEEQVRDFGERKGKQYVDIMLRLSARSIFREFHSYFTFTLPEDTSGLRTRIGLWYGEGEKEKEENAQYLLTRFPNAAVKVFEGYGHAEYWLKNVDGYLNDVAAFTGMTDMQDK